MRIAREICRPISEVLEFPDRELCYWAAVFREENGGENAEIEKFRRIMR